MHVYSDGSSKSNIIVNNRKSNNYNVNYLMHHPKPPSMAALDNITNDLRIEF